MRGRRQWRWPDAAPQAAGGHETRPYETLAAHLVRKLL